MHVQFVNGTVRQRQLFQDALDQSKYPRLIDSSVFTVPARINVSWVPQPTAHNDFAWTSDRQPDDIFNMEIRQDLDDPNRPAPFNGDAFYKETVVHELAHVLMGYMSTPSQYEALSQLFRASYPGNWSPSGAWEDRVNESVAETFKDLFAGDGNRKFLNRTHRRLKQDDMDAFLAHWYRQSGTYPEAQMPACPNDQPGGHGDGPYGRVDVQTIDNLTITPSGPPSGTQQYALAADGTLDHVWGQVGGDHYYLRGSWPTDSYSVFAATIDVFDADGNFIHSSAGGFSNTRPDLFPDLIPEAGFGNFWPAGVDWARGPFTWTLTGTLSLIPPTTPGFSQALAESWWLYGSTKPSGIVWPYPPGAPTEVGGRLGGRGITRRQQTRVVGRHGRSEIDAGAPLPGAGQIGGDSGGILPGQTTTGPGRGRGGIVRK